MTVTFHAEIYKVQTLVDGGLRLTLTYQRRQPCRRHK